MPGTKNTLPLVFALAMAVEASSASAEVLHMDAKLEPGSFAGLLDAFQNGLAAAAPDQPSEGDDQIRQAQWGNFPNFPNFFNCFSGNWRNC